MFLDRAGAKEFNHRSLSLGRFGEEERSRGVLVQSVKQNELAFLGEGLKSRRTVGADPCRFVVDDEVVVFKQDSARLPTAGFGCGGLDVEGYAVARPQLSCAMALDAVVHPAPALVDHALQGPCRVGVSVVSA